MGELSSSQETFQHRIKYFFISLVTLPWIIPLIVWIIITWVVFTLLGEPATNPTRIISGDFSNLYTYFSGWLIITFVFVSSLVITFFTQQVKYTLLYFLINLLCMSAYAMVLWSELEIFLRIRGIS